MAVQDIALSPAAETSLPLMSRLHELVVTVDHKKLGLMYIGSRTVLFRGGGFTGFGHPHAVGRAE